MSWGHVVHLYADNLRLAAIASVRYKLAMANAIIWQTVELRQAQFFTQDGDLKDASGVLYHAKVAV